MTGQGAQYAAAIVQQIGPDRGLLHQAHHAVAADVRLTRRTGDLKADALIAALPSLSYCIGPAAHGAILQQPVVQT